jgi:hypothetical protein
MAHFFKGLFVLFLFCACSKADLHTPVTIAEPVKYFADYKDANVSIIKITGKQTGANQITFSFATEFEKNLASIEVYGSASERSLCTIYERAIPGNSTSVKQYNVIDEGPKAGNNFYLIKYTTKTGEWFISPVYTIALK